MEQQLNFTFQLTPDGGIIKLTVEATDVSTKTEHSYNIYTDNLTTRVEDIVNGHVATVCNKLIKKIKQLRSTQKA